MAAAAMKCEPIRAIIIELILDALKAECVHLCGQRVSLLRRTTPSDLVSLKWGSVISEWKKETPLFYSFLFAVAAPPRPKNATKGISLTSRYPAVCMAGSILMNERNKHMSAIQHLVGILLFHGDCHKLVRK